MAGSIDMFFVDVSSAALALGDRTMTDTVASTAAWPGGAIGFAAAVAVAQDTAPGTPETSATTDVIATGGSMTSSQGSHWSIDFPYGPTPTSVEVSLTFVATHGGGDVFSGYDLVSSSLHGLL
jgi:hypothetical protein